MTCIRQRWKAGQNTGLRLSASFCEPVRQSWNCCNQDYPRRGPHLHHAIRWFPAPSAEHCVQSQIKLPGIGSCIAGARTSADVDLTLRRVPKHADGAAMGWFACVREPFDWIGPILRSSRPGRPIFHNRLLRRLLRHSLFALSYAGNLWAWTPQVRIGIASSCRNSNVSVQGGFSIHSQVILPADPYIRFRPGRNVGPARLCRESFPQPTRCSDRILP